MFLARGGNLVLVTVAAAIGAGAGWALPTVGLRLLASRRARAFEQVLPDVLMLVATSLKSGFGLPQALDAVAKDAAEPAGKEFSRALAETRIGTDVSDALDHMAARMDSTAMRWAVMAIRIQREVGGNLADTLLTTAKTLRERASLRRQVSTLSAEGRLSAYILIALPVGVFFYMLAVNYDYISLLWTQLLGIVMLVGGHGSPCHRRVLDASRRQDRGLRMLLLLVGAGLVATAVLAGVLTLVASSSGSSGVAKSLSLLDHSVGDRSVVRVELDAKDRLVTPLYERTRKIAMALSSSGTADRLTRQLDKAGNPAPWTVERIMGAKGASLLLGALLGVLYGGISAAWGCSSPARSGRRSSSCPTCCSTTSACTVRTTPPKGWPRHWTC